MSNEIKNNQLGMPIGTASARLRKALLYSLIKETGKDCCFRCGKIIGFIDDLSIEHKIPWLHSDNPKELFFDLENISFSHLSCNVNARRKRDTQVEIVTCKRCKREFNLAKYDIKSKLSQGQEDFYCSRSCSGKDRGKGYGRRNFS